MDYDVLMGKFPTCGLWIDCRLGDLWLIQMSFHLYSYVHFIFWQTLTIDCWYALYIPLYIWMLRATFWSGVVLFKKEGMNRTYNRCPIHMYQWLFLMEIEVQTKLILTNILKIIEIEFLIKLMFPIADQVYVSKHS